MLFVFDRLATAGTAVASRQETDRNIIDIDMWKTFSKYVTVETECLLRLLEVSTEFPKTEINDLFNKQIDQLRQQVQQPEIRRELERAKGFDFCGYVARSLRNAGFQNADIDPMVSDTIERLLIQPGNLIRGWQGPPSTFMPRVKLSIRNAVLNLVDKRQRRRRWFPHVSPESVEIAAHSVPGEEELVEKFRRQVEKELGPVALAVLDIRLDGGNTKSLVGMPELTSPSAYQVKRAVQQIKALAKDFGDPEFQTLVLQAMSAEKETLAKRFGTTAAVATG